MIRLDRLTQKEVEELLLLKEKIFGNDMFVEVDFKDPDDRRYNELMLKAFGHKNTIKIL